MININIFMGKEETYLECDECEKTHIWDHAIPRTTIYKKGRDMGWSIGKRHICKRCRKGAKNDNTRSD